MIKVLFHYCVVVFAIVGSCPSGTKKAQKIPTGTTKYLKSGSGWVYLQDYLWNYLTGVN